MTPTESDLCKKIPKTINLFHQDFFYFRKPFEKDDHCTERKEFQEQQRRQLTVKMNQILKVILQRERILLNKGLKNLSESPKMFSAHFCNYNQTNQMTCHVLTSYNGQDIQKRSVDFIRTYAKNQNNNKEPETIIMAKPLNKMLRKKRIREALEGQHRKIQRGVESALIEKRIALKNTRRKIQEKGRIIMEDLKETKNKMKEKIEEVIERENVYTIPNVLCVTRIALSPFLGYLIVSNQFGYALTFMTVAGISDLVDGWIARNYKNQSSKIGSFLDPMADKVLIGTLFLTLSYVNLIPVSLTALILGRDIILIISGFVIRYRSLPPPRTLSRYFDVTHATAQLAPTLISKINTGIQLALVGTTLIAPIAGFINHPFLHAMWYVTAGSTIAAAASYLFSKETYKYLKNTKSKKSS